MSRSIQFKQSISLQVEEICEMILTESTWTDDACDSFISVVIENRFRSIQDDEDWFAGLVLEEFKRQCPECEFEFESMDENDEEDLVLEFSASKVIQNGE